MGRAPHELELGRAAGRHRRRARRCAGELHGQLGKNVEVGAIYEGTVTEIKDFGAIVELFPGADGLCHISQLAEGYVESVSAVCKIGDRLKVKVLSVEDNRVRLSRKAALKEEAGTPQA